MASSRSPELLLQILHSLAEFTMSLLDLLPVGRSQAPELDVHHGPRLHFREGIPVHERSVGRLRIRGSQHHVEDGVRVARRDGNGVVDVYLAKNVL